MATDDLSEESAVLAGELALGVLDGPERAAALRRVVADRDFARAVEWWRARFGDLFLEWPDTAPPAGLEERVMAAIDGHVRPSAPAGGRAWRWATLAVSLVAASLLAALLLRPESLPPRPAAAPAPLVAVLVPTDEGKPVAALLDRGAGEVRLAGGVPATVPAGRVAELWSIGGDGVPYPLGVLPDGSLRLVLRPEDRARLAAGAVLAISIEPPGGSPTGKPTGPVVATGPLSET